MALEASSVLSPTPIPSELAEEGCVCSLLLFSVAKESSFSCVAVPPLLLIRVKIAVRELLFDRCHHVDWEDLVP